jgi:FkbM family methyltransferase
LQLDLQFLLLHISTPRKLEFILKKYWALLLEIVSPVLRLRRKVRIFGQWYNYDDKYGLAVLQGTFIDNAFLNKFIPENAIIVDIGANIGQFNLFSRNYLKAKRVYSFEPVNQTFSYLKLNCPKLSYQAAVSIKKTLKLYIAELSVWTSAYLSNPTEKVEYVKGVKLDGFSPISDERIIDLFKIDTEGTELDVLKASKTILKKSKYILIEVQFLHLADSNIREILNYLEGELPGVSIVRIGRAYNSEYDGTTGSADVLIQNPHV